MVRKIVNIISTVLLIVLIILVIFIFYTRATGGVPELFGYQIYRVQTGSMSPTLEIGDVILSRRIEPSDIHKGDIITYRGTEGEMKDKLITHEVISEPVLGSGGDYTIHTQGTVKGALPDPAIDGDQVMGKYISTLKVLNHLYSFFLSPYGLIVFILVIVGLFVYEMISLVLSYNSLDDETPGGSEKKQQKKAKKKK